MLSILAFYLDFLWIIGQIQHGVHFLWDISRGMVFFKVYHIICYLLKFCIVF